MSPEIEHLITLQHTDREIQRLRLEIWDLVPPAQELAFDEFKAKGVHAVAATAGGTK